MWRGVRALAVGAVVLAGVAVVGPTPAFAESGTATISPSSGGATTPISITGPSCPTENVERLEILGPSGDSAERDVFETARTETSTTWTLPGGFEGELGDSSSLRTGDYVARLWCNNTDFAFSGLTVMQTLDTDGNGTWVSQPVAIHTLSVHVAADNQPSILADVDVYFSGSHVALWHSATDDNGNVRFVVPDGQYDVSAHVYSNVPGGDYQPAATTVNVSADMSVTLTLALPPGPVVSGTVRNSEGRVAGALVSFGAAFAYTDENGSYSVHVPDGPHQLTVSGGGGQPGVGMPVGDWSLSTGANGFVASGATMSGDITLPPAVTLHLRVTDESGTPFVDVSINPATQPAAQPLERPDARFTVRPGVGTLLGAPIASGYVHVPEDSDDPTTGPRDGTATYVIFPSTPEYLDVRQVNAPYQQTTAELPAISADTNLTVPIAAPPTVTGRLLDHRGVPVANASACLTAASLPGQPGTSGGCGSTDSSGHFSFSVLAAQYRLSIVTRGRGGGADVPTDGWSLELGTPVVDATHDVDLGDLALPAPVHIGVLLVDASEIPMPSTKLYWDQADGYPIRATPGFGSVGGYAVTTGGLLPLSTADPIPSIVTDSHGVADLALWPVGPIVIKADSPSGRHLMSQQHIDTTHSTAVTLLEGLTTLEPQGDGMTLTGTPTSGAISTRTHVTVTADFPGVPDGSTVTFSVDGAAVGAVTDTFVNDTATYDVGVLYSGTHVISAVVSPTLGQTQAAWTRSVEVTVASPSMVGADMATEYLDAHVADGALTITVQGFVTPSPTTPVSGNVVTLPEAELDASAAFIVTSGPIVPVVVADTRAGDLGYSVIGSLSDFAGTAGSIAATHVGWTPQFVGSTRFPSAPTASQAGLTDGGVVAPVDDGRAGGLATSRLLFSARAGGSNGSVTYGANLVVHAPTATLPGNYRATLTITVVG
jgi:hypothetical protein